MNIGGRKIPFLWALPLVAFLTFHYFHLLGDLNGSYFNNSGDGLKNYYSAWYHVEHDPAYTWSEGMNYPYGEHPVFTDAQPLISNTLKFISDNLIDVSSYTVGILHFLMLLSFLITGWFLYKILLRFGVEEGFAILIASAITLLSPQMHRMAGHFALAYSFFVPMFWYLWLRFFDAPNWLRTLRIGIWLFLFAWVHPYYVMIGGMFGMALWFVYFLQKRKETEWKFYFHALLQIILPLVLFQVLLKLSDPVGDRPDSPWGHTAYNTQLKTLFFPMYIPELRWMRSWVPPVRPGQWEGAAYLSLAGGLTTLAILYGFIRRLFVRASSWKLRIQTAFRLRGDARLRQSTAAAFLLLLLALGIPFSINPEISTEIFPPIKQFRSMGRFAWVFYYVWTVYAFRFLYLNHRKWRWQGKKGLAYGLMAAALLFTFYEGWAFHQFLSAKTEPGEVPGLTTPIAEAPYTAWIDDIPVNDYQALLVLPYFHFGSENFSTDETEGITPAFSASLRSGLPLINVMASRVSFGQSYEQLSAILQSIAGKPGHFAEDSRPVLVMVVGEPKGRYAGKHFYEGEAPLWQQGNVRLYSYKGIAPKTLTNNPDTLLSLDFGKPDINKGAVLELFPQELDHSQAQVIWEGKIPGSPGSKVTMALQLFLKADLFPTLQIRIDEVLPNGKLEKIAGFFANDQLSRLQGGRGIIEKEFLIPESGNPIQLRIKPHKQIKRKGAVFSLAFTKGL